MNIDRERGRSRRGNCRGEGMDAVGLAPVDVVVVIAFAMGIFCLAQGTSILVALYAAWW